MVLFDGVYLMGLCLIDLCTNCVNKRRPGMLALDICLDLCIPNNAWWLRIIAKIARRGSAEPSPCRCPSHTRNLPRLVLGTSTRKPQQHQHSRPTTLPLPLPPQGLICLQLHQNGQPNPRRCHGQVSTPPPLSLLFSKLIRMQRYGLLEARCVPDVPNDLLTALGTDIVS